MALVLAYLQAGDSDCQQRGENEWEWNRSGDPAASFRETPHPRLLRSPLSEHQDLCDRVQQVELTRFLSLSVVVATANIYTYIHIYTHTLVNTK